jgi:hypothetical protein
MNEFKKVFNQAKLNAPKFEEPAPSSMMTKSHSNMSMSSSSLNVTTASSKSKSMPSSAEKAHKTAKKNAPSPPPSPRSPKRVDFSKFEPLNGAPRVNDKLAFQVSPCQTELHISIILTEYMLTNMILICIGPRNFGKLYPRDFRLQS